jgi:hypothetical protein
VAELHDVGGDGLPETGDTGEGDGIPTLGEPSFDRTDLNESDQIGLTGFKMNRIRAGQGNPNPETDNILFYTESANWPERLFEQFSDPDSTDRFDEALAENYNIGFLFASGPFTLKAGKTERFSLALAYGGDLGELRRAVNVVQQIYNANYRFAVPPPLPTVTAEVGEGYVRLSWDDVAERGADPVTAEFDFEGYRIYRSTDPEFRDPRIIVTGTGTGPIGNGRPVAQFDLADGRTGFSDLTVEGVAYYLGEDSGLIHTWTDTTVTDGQDYYYAVTAYDFGSEAFGFYPSENAITPSRTPRGGLILPSNVVAVRPNPRVLGYVPAAAGAAAQIAGRGVGTVVVDVVNSGLVADDHVYKIVFFTPAPDSIRASTYALVDSTTGEILFSRGRELEGHGVGQVGGGLLPIVSTQATVLIDSARTGFAPGSSTNARLVASYQPGLSINLRRTGFPEDVSVVFSDVVVDSSIGMFPNVPVPAKFRAYAHADTGDIQLDFEFLDFDLDGTLSLDGEYIDILTYYPEAPFPQNQITWHAELDTLGQSDRGPLRSPGAGDAFGIKLTRPLSSDDVFVFRTTGERIDGTLARAEFGEEPYVVPNPYVASASFEPERFAVSGRGERRLEFRGLPSRCTIRIFTVRGELVQTLHHDGSRAGYVSWNLRTKDNLEVAPGLYLFHVDGRDLGSHIGKFAIIK